MEARPCNFAHHLALSTFIAIAVSFCAFPTISAAAQQLLLQQQQEADEVSPSSSSAASSSASSSSGGFAIAVGARFQVDGHALYLNGFNAYYLAYTAMDSPAMAAALLQRAAAAGFTLCRTWAFNDGSAASSYHAMQVAPGVYDEAAFRALDFVLQQARRLRLRLLLSLCNNYPNMGGKSRYVEWARSSSSSGGGDEIPSDDHFFTNPITKALYKNYVKYVLTRVNTLTGVAYKDDPTIFAWELMNEPRCSMDPSGDTLHAWIAEMSAYVKSIDANHMVEAGLEGFYGASTADRLQFNPPGVGLDTGTDYIRFGAIETIDFTTVHSYPDMWLSSSAFPQQVEFLGSWIDSHIRDGSVLGKPVLFTEFGYNQHNQAYSDMNRDDFFAEVYKAVYASAMADGPAAGALVWQLCSEEIEGTMVTDGYGVLLSPDSSLTALIMAQSQRLSALSQ